MKLLCLDFETFFDRRDFTLSKMTTEEYIRDPRFEAHGCGFRRLDEDRGWWVDGPKLKTAFSHAAGAIDWANTAVLCHHAQFDGLILSHHYGVTPGMWLDTLSMARAIRGNHVRASLGSLAKEFGLQEKTVPYDLMTGRRWCNMEPWLQQKIADGCLHDIDLTIEVFKRLMATGFPREELQVIDQTVRMFTEPRIVGDEQIFRRVQGEEWTRKNEMLLDLGVSEKAIASAPQFCALLEAEGVEVEYKWTAKGETPAIAKTDLFLRELTDDPNPRVAALATARMEIKSTLAETRAGRLAAITGRGRVPVYLAYAGAHTLRWAGGQACNFQNFPREGALRSGLLPPEGYVFISVDLSQIECRIVNWLAGNYQLVHTMHEKGGGFVYCGNATKLFNREIKKSDLAEYTVGKKQELGCGFGMGWKRFKSMVYGDTQMVFEDDFCQRAIDQYRTDHWQVKDYWYENDRLLPVLAAGGEHGFGSTPDRPYYIKDQRIYGPNGTWMNYTLFWLSEAGKWARCTRDGYRFIWGGGLTENIVQYLARIIFSQGCLRVETKYGLRPVLSEHDGVSWLVKTEDAERLLPLLEAEMATTPDWLPGIPLAAEGKIMSCHGK